MNKSLKNLFAFFVLVMVTICYDASAQNTAHSPLEGSIHSYAWDGIPEGSGYTFFVTAESEEISGAYDFIGENSGVVGNDGTASANIRWNEDASRFSFWVWLEVSLFDCTNIIFKEVAPQPNNRVIDLDATSGFACYTNSDNSFTINFITLDNDGQPLGAAHFPIEIGFSVNNKDFSQTITFGQQTVLIDETMFRANFDNTTSLEIELTRATDVNNTGIKIGPKNIYSHTIYSVPAIEFATENKDTVPLNSFYSFDVTGHPSNNYTWWFINEEGFQTGFISESSSTENYFWDAEGEFTLFVQATDQNGCLSEIISKPFIVEKIENFVPSLVALPDINVGYENSLITGNVGTNDFDFLDQEFKLIYTLKGDPPEGLTFFDNGAYEYQPPQGFIGKVNFSYRVCFEQVPESCAGSDVELRILPNNPVGNIAPVASTDAALTLPGKTVNSNLVVNDIDPDGFGGALIVGTNPVNGPANGSVVINTNGTFSYTPDVGFIGIDRFLYQVCDNGNEPECDSAWVYIIVSQFGGNGQKPVSASDDMFLYVENTEYSLRENDYGLLGENLVYNTSPEIDVAHGSLQLYPDGTFFYTPDEGYYGVDWFIYSVCNTEENPVCRKGTGFILVTREKQFISLAGRDTTIGTCAPFTLNATHLGEGFNYLWQPGELLDDSTSRTPVFTPGNSTLFKLTVTNQFGFESKDSVKVAVVPVIADAGEETFMYRNQEAVLDGTASSGAGLQFYWSTENGNIKSGENTSHPVIDKFGTYYLQVTDAFGCVALDTVRVGLLTYSPVAQNDYDSADYQSGVKIYVLDNDYDPENDIDSLSLSIQRPPFNGTASIDYTDFTVNYMPNKGFSGTDELEYQICDTFINCDNANVFIVVAESRFFIPDAFSPNNDGINDYFEILGIGLYEGNSLEIFNRWGNRVYRADNYGISTSPLFWDGKSNTGFTFGNDDLPSGTYFYVLNLGNGEKRIVGSVYLDR